MEEYLREAYKQGYLNALYDADNFQVNATDENFDGWISEVMADKKVGDLKLKELEE